MLGVLGINSRFDGVAVDTDLVLHDRQFFARRDAELPFDEIESGDRLRHRMFDLKAGVHFDEPERIGAQPARAVGHELDCTRAAIADRLGRSDCGGTDLRAQFRRHAGGRRFLNHLLVASLQRAIALAEVNGVAVPVGKDLDLDVPRRGNVFLDQDAACAECRLAFADCAFERGVEIGMLVHAAHAAAAAAGRRFDQDRIADLVGFLLEELGVLPFTVIAGHDRHVRLLHQGLGAILEPHRANGRRRGPDEDDPGQRAGVGEVGILGQEAIAGMNTFRAGFFGGFDQPLDRKVAVTGFGRTDEIGLVAQPRVQRALVRSRINGDRAHAEPLGSACDATGDFAAVSNKDGAKHSNHWVRVVPAPGCGGDSAGLSWTGPEAAVAAAWDAGWFVPGPHTGSTGGAGSGGAGATA